VAEFTMSRIGVLPMSAELGTVGDRSFSIANFRLQNGSVMPTAKIVYETYGRLAAGARNALLITHGYTSSHHAAGRNSANGNLPGWWDGLIGPGKAIDTDKLFVVSSNMLGSSSGSTNAASIDPHTGEPYGPDFPAITVRDIVAAEKALLDSLGVEYYGRGGAKAVLTELRVEMLKRNGIEAALAPRYPDREAREAEIRKQAVDWARRWDTNSLVILRRGTIGYDTVRDFGKIQAKVLYVLCRTDRLFPPLIAPGVMHDLAAAGVDARYFEIDSDLGHSASGPEHAKWSPVLREFLEPLMAQAAQGRGSLPQQ